jgi:ABC-type branched-subunit amino acid transport system ATPase component
VLQGAGAAGAVELGLASILNRMPRELSHGTRRLVGIARALATQPSILLLDEPAAGLNEGETRELGDVIRRLAHEWGIGILLVEHDMSLVMSLCSRIVVLEYGRIIAEGMPSEIVADQGVVSAFLGSAYASIDVTAPSKITGPDEIVGR